MNAKLRRASSLLLISIACAALILNVVSDVLAGPTGRNNPLAGDGVHPVLYYYDYSDDGVTTDQIIHDKTNNTNDTTPLLNPNEAYASLGNPPTRDDLVTTLADGERHPGGIGGAPNSPFVFADPTGLDFLLPNARPVNFDENQGGGSGHGGLTITQNVLTNADIYAAGGYTFETYLKRTTSTAFPDTLSPAPQIIWIPEGTHSIEILPNGQLQFAIRQVASFTTPVAPALPLNEWHHVLAVMDMDESTPDTTDAIYRLFIDGVQIGGTAPGGTMVNQLSGSLEAGEINLETSMNLEHGLGWQENGSPNFHFRGQMALTRLSLGALTLEQSLFLSTTPQNNGDYNQNGVVDAADYVLWRNTLTQSVPNGTGADGSGNGIIDQPDYDFWKGRFGMLVGSGAGAGQLAGVPEPSALLLLVIGINSFPFVRVVSNRSPQNLRRRS